MLKFPSIALTLLLLISYVQPVFSESKLYRWVDKQGVTHFTKEPPKEEDVGENSTQGVNQNLIHQKSEYLRQRAELDEQISGTINDQRREQLKRQRMVLDYNWYKQTDPQKAKELEAQLGEPQIRVVPKTAEPKSDLEKYKAFY